jgi:hypothetical protein
MTVVLAQTFIKAAQSVLDSVDLEEGEEEAKGGSYLLNIFYETLKAKYHRRGLGSVETSNFKSILSANGDYTLYIKKEDSEGTTLYLRAFSYTQGQFDFVDLPEWLLDL